MDVNIEFSVTGAGDVDLLDPENEQAFTQNEIGVLYLVDGVEFAAPDGFSIYQHENGFRIRIFPNTDAIDEFPVTFIEWNSTTKDKIACEVERIDNTQIVRKVWFNDELLWESSEDERYIEIIK